MADVRSMFDRDFLYAYDLQGRDVTVTIDRVVPGEVSDTKGKKTKKPVVYLKGTKKGLVLNVTNVKTIGALYGFKAEDLPGKRITLYPTTCQFGPNTVECIRIRPTQPKANAKDAPPADAPAPEREPGADDDAEAVA